MRGVSSHGSRKPGEYRRTAAGAHVSSSKRYMYVRPRGRFSSRYYCFVCLALVPVLSASLGAAAPMTSVMLLHHRADAEVAAWATHILKLALSGLGVSILSDTVPHAHGSRGSHVEAGDGSPRMLRLAWRDKLAQAVHRIRAQDGMLFGSNEPPLELPTDRLVSTLREIEAEDAASTGSVLLADDLAGSLVPTLSRSFAELGIDGLKSPLMSPGMTSEALALLDAYATLTASAVASVPASAASAAIATVAGKLHMEDYYVLRKALVGSTALGGESLNVRLEAAGNHSRHSRRSRRQTLVQHIHEAWRPSTVSSQHGSASQRLGWPLTARALVGMHVPMCRLIRNLPHVCLALIGTTFEAAFGEVGANGCRCPPPTSHGPPTAPLLWSSLLVGTHHKTGTVLLEMLVLELAKFTDVSSYHKPRWADCREAKLPTPLPPYPPLSYHAPPPPAHQRTGGGVGVAASKGRALAATRNPIPVSDGAASLPSLLSLPSLDSLGIGHSPPVLFRALCVSEHARELPPQPWTDQPFVHVIRDPLEVCVSSYQYALRANESWLRVPNTLNPALGGRSYQQFYREAPTRVGVQTECRRCLKELGQAARLYEGTAARPSTLTLRFEELEASFEPTVRRLFAFAGAAGAADWRGRARFEQLVVAATRHDLSRRPPNTNNKEGGHVSNASQKNGLRALLLDSPLAAELQRLRERLGYASTHTATSVAAATPSISPISRAGGDAGWRRRWMLASLARPSDAASTPSDAA